MGDGKQYGCSRDFAASLGLVPRQYSTGGKSNLLGISQARRQTSSMAARAMCAGRHASAG
jgi:transposase